jgi:hypothetical protein
VSGNAHFATIEPFERLEDVEVGDNISFVGGHSPAWYEVVRIDRDGVYGIFRTKLTPIGATRGAKLVARFHHPLPNREPVKVTLHGS